MPPGPHKPAKMSDLAEESEGWFRLRTITSAWDSDEEGGPTEDLRNKLKVGSAANGGGSPEAYIMAVISYLPFPL